VALASLEQWQLYSNSIFRVILSAMGMSGHALPHYLLINFACLCTEAGIFFAARGKKYAVSDTATRSKKRVCGL
jgi:hypothetical protein